MTEAVDPPMLWRIPRETAEKHRALLTRGVGRPRLVVADPTDAVALSSGADRRVVAVFAFLQAILPLLVYLAALDVPALAPANRRALEARP